MTHSMLTFSDVATVIAYLEVLATAVAAGAHMGAWRERRRIDKKIRALRAEFAGLVR